jgi:hypothetical protein
MEKYVGMGQNMIAGYSMNYLVGFSMYQVVKNWEKSPKWRKMKKRLLNISIAAHFFPKLGAS